MNDILPINILAGRTGPGHNQPPLAEVLAEELIRYRTRAGELLAAAGAARITNEDDAGKAADLVLLIHNFENELDSARKHRKRPYLSDCRVIDAAFGDLIGPLARARRGDEDTIGLVEMIGRWQANNGDTPVYASYSSIGSRREIEFVIESMPDVIGWLTQHHGGALAHAARTIVDAELRRMGVDAAETAQIPGVSVSVARKIQVR